MQCQIVSLTQESASPSSRRFGLPGATFCTWLPTSTGACVYLTWQVELTALFGPQLEKAVNYNVICRVRNKPTPLVLNVKEEGYALHNSLLQELPDGSTLELSAKGVNSLDFGQVRRGQTGDASSAGDAIGW